MEKIIVICLLAFVMGFVIYGTYVQDNAEPVSETEKVIFSGGGLSSKSVEQAIRRFDDEILEKYALRLWDTNSLAHQPGHYYLDYANHYGSVSDTNITGDLNVFGEIRFKAVERHYIVDPERFRFPATNYPAEDFEGIFYTLDFDKDTNESAYATEHFPYRAQENEEIEVEVAWLHDSSDNGKVEWCIEYIAVGEGDTVNGTTTKTCQASAGSHTEGEIVRTEFLIGLNTTTWSSDDDIGIRLYRGATSASDTLGEDARMIDVHFHFLQDRLGKPT